MLKRILHFLFGKDETPVRRTVWSESIILPTAKPERKISRPTTWTLPNGDTVEFD